MFQETSLSLAGWCEPPSPCCDPLLVMLVGNMAIQAAHLRKSLSTAQLAFKQSCLQEAIFLSLKALATIFLSMLHGG